MHTFIIAEIGINHNGNLKLAQRLIDTAVIAGCDAVKFQKRTIDKVYTQEYLDQPRQSPWGSTQRDQKEGLEFGKAEYDLLDSYCKEKEITWYASAWDLESQYFLQQYDCRYNKIASAMLTNEELLVEVAREGKYTFLATGMSTMDEIDRAVSIFRELQCPFELMHCNSTYPMPLKDANLSMLHTLRDRFCCPVGYSGHEEGTLVSSCAAALGAASIERHITLDRSMYGSDQKASIEPNELYKLVRDIRAVEKMIGEGKKFLTEAELNVRQKLRG